MLHRVPFHTRELTGILLLFLPANSPWKGKMYTLLLDRGLRKKWYPWRIWVIIDAPHPAYRKRRLNRPWGGSIINNPLKGGKESLDCVLDTANRLVCVRWCPWIWTSSPKALQGVTTIPFPSLQFLIMSYLVGSQVLSLPTLPVVQVPFWCNLLLYLVSYSGFYFKPTSSSIILIDPV